MSHLVWEVSDCFAGPVNEWLRSGVVWRLLGLLDRTATPAATQHRRDTAVSSVQK